MYENLGKRFNYFTSIGKCIKTDIWHQTNIMFLKIHEPIYSSIWLSSNPQSLSIIQAATRRAEGKAEAQEFGLGGLSSSSHQQLQVPGSEQKNIH